MLDGVYLSTHEGRFVDVNPAFVRMFGYPSKQEMLDIKDIKKELYFSPEERGSHILDTGQEEVEMYRMRRKDGSEIWVEDHGRYIHDADGKVIFHEGILRDVTKRRQMEDRLNALHEHALKLASARELNEIVKHTLDAMEFTLGFNHADFWMARGESFYVQDSRGNPFHVKKVSKGGSGLIVKAATTNCTIRISDTRREPAFLDDPTRSPNGDVLHMLSELTVPVLVGNEAVAVLNVENAGVNAFSEHDQMLLEILASHVSSALNRLQQQGEVRRYSERLEELVKERSGRLAESEARYRRLFESSPISLWEEDFSEVKKYFDIRRKEGIQDFDKQFLEHPDDLERCASIVKIVDVNETTLKLYGAKSVEELRGELRRVFTQEFQDRFRDELVALSKGETRFASEFDNQTLTGETKHVSLLLNVVPGYEDTLAKVLVAIIDLTERKEMEQRLQQSERLAAVGETAAMVGHDLRNPLQGIAGALHLLKQDSLTEREKAEVLEVMQKSLEYSDAIIRDLSDYAMELQLSPTETSPKMIVASALRSVKIPANILLQDLSEDYPKFRADADRLRRVFVNLIENALDAMLGAGTLTIGSRLVEGGMEIAVTDTGSGIPEKVLNNPWKPLQTTKAKGLGLGLAICKRIVDAHGGSISLKSKVAEGTTVTVRLPIKHPTEGVKQK
jgi:PAS domain S-box-containing protein